MKPIFVLTVGLAISACATTDVREDRSMDTSKSANATPSANTNPLLEDFSTPFGVPPFDLIKPEHFSPAIERAIAIQKEEVNKIANASDQASFENTIAALDASGELLSRTTNIFFNLIGADTNDKLQKIARSVLPSLSMHRDEIYMNDKLFQRTKEVYAKRDALNLNSEQSMLLKKTYKLFVRSGALLDPSKKERLKKINEQMSLLQLQFGENILKEDNAFTLLIEDQKELAGLPEGSISAANEAADKAGHQGNWLFSLHKPSLIPFLQYSKIRDYRKKMFLAYINRGNNNNELDNKGILAKIVRLRAERAHLLGYKTHAHYVLEENMAQNPKNVYGLLDQLWQAVDPVTRQDAKQLQQMMTDDLKDNNKKLQPWDWWYYTEKVRKAKYDLSDDELRPYFVLENVQKGAFEVTSKLFGLTFRERTDVPIYHQDVKVYEVMEADGSHIGLLYLDYFPRASKRGGAWMSNYREQYKKDGKIIRPVICNVFNFSQPTGDKPALLTFEEVRTLFHEFGHALHGLLSEATYRSLSGTSVARDFVELPSQFMENWAAEPSVLKMYATHYKTGETIPQQLVDKIVKTSRFNRGFEITEYLAACFLDMDWHTLEKPEIENVDGFEKESLSKIGLINEIVSRYRSTYFRHIFSGGYSSGYYSYIWAAVLDADAFEAFKEAKTLFDKDTAKAFRKYILSRGGTEEPMILYKRFRGAEPSVKALMKRDGLQ